VPADSPLKTVADLKGKTVASTRARTSTTSWSRRSSAGLQVFRHHGVVPAPADARAAFEKGAVDAWVI
jgi:sulfonate transport system substrate-binding protein